MFFTIKKLLERLNKNPFYTTLASTFVGALVTYAHTSVEHNRIHKLKSARQLKVKFQEWEYGAAPVKDKSEIGKMNEEQTCEWVDAIINSNERIMAHISLIDDELIDPKLKMMADLASRVLVTAEREVKAALKDLKVVRESKESQEKLHEAEESLLRAQKTLQNSVIFSAEVLDAVYYHLNRFSYSWFRLTKQKQDVIVARGLRRMRNVTPQNAYVRFQECITNDLNAVNDEHAEAQREIFRRLRVSRARDEM